MLLCLVFIWWTFAFKALPKKGQNEFWEDGEELGNENKRLKALLLFNPIRILFLSDKNVGWMDGVDKVERKKEREITFCVGERWKPGGEVRSSASRCASPLDKINIDEKEK